MSSDFDFEELDVAISDWQASKQLPKQQLSTNRRGIRPSHRSKLESNKTKVETKEPARGSGASSRVDSSTKGHFMDVIHPSSDINVHNKHNFAKERQAQLSIMRRHVSSSIKKQPSKISVVAADEKPAELHSPSVDTKLVADIQNTPPQRVKTHQPTRRSPFLPDVKVEKKPLGSPMHNQAQVHREQTYSSDEEQQLDNMVNKILSGNDTQENQDIKKGSVTKILRIISWTIGLIFVAAAGSLVAIYFYYNGFRG